MSTGPIGGPFDRWTAQSFFEIRPGFREKIACQQPKSLAAGYITKSQTSPSLAGKRTTPAKPKKRGKTILQFDHFNFNVLDLERSLVFYRQALELEVVEEKEAGNGPFKLMCLGDGETGFRLKLTWLRDRTEPYDLGEQEFHLVFVTDRFDALLARHRTMGCVCSEGPDMGVYFTGDPDGYWIELVPERG